MDFSPLIFSPAGRLRAGWRFLLFVGLFLILNSLAAWLTRSIPMPPLVGGVGLFFVSVALASYLSLRLLDGRPFAAVGFPADRRALAEAGAGLALGACMVIAVVAGERATGAIRFQMLAISRWEAARSLAEMTPVLLLSAASEELLFRGYGFQRLVEGIHREWAIGFSSVVFGWLHFGNPHANALSITNTILAGVMLSLAFLVTRALWFPIALHFSWNWTMALAGLPVSGLDLMDMPWSAAPSSAPVWLHGGDYGPEGGAVATAVLALVIVVLTCRLARAAKSGSSEFPEPPL